MIENKINAYEQKYDDVISAVIQRSHDNLNPTFLGQNLEHRHESLKIVVDKTLSLNKKAG